MIYVYEDFKQIEMQIMLSLHYVLHFQKHIYRRYRKREVYITFHIVPYLKYMHITQCAYMQIHQIPMQVMINLHYVGLSNSQNTYIIHAGNGKSTFSYLKYITRYTHMQMKKIQMHKLALCYMLPKTHTLQIEETESLNFFHITQYTYLKILGRSRCR